MEPEEVTRQRMEIRARLNLENDLRMFLHSQRGNTNLGAVGQSMYGPSQQSMLGGNFAMHSLQTNPVSAFQQSLANHNGHLGMTFQGIPQRIPLTQDSSQLIVMNAADLSRLLNPVVTSAPPIIILPSAALQLQGSGQQRTIPHGLGMPPPQFAMPQDRFAHHQRFGQEMFLPGVGQIITAKGARGESIMPEESKSSVSAQRGTVARNPLELLASASSIPNYMQPNVPTATAMAYSVSVVPPSTPEQGERSHIENTKPKRPLSAYNIFFRDERAKIIAGELSNEEKAMLQKGHLFEDQHTSSGIKESRRKQPHRKAGFQEMARIIGARWKKIDPNRLQMYEKMSALGRIKYSRDLQIWARREKKDVMKPIQRLAERNMEKVAPKGTWNIGS